MSGQPDSLSASYAACRRAARRSRSSFYPFFVFLPARKRRAMDALYAFMRRTDDLTDSHQPLAQRREALARWRAELVAALEDRPSAAASLRNGPPSLRPAEDRAAAVLLPAVADTVRRFQIPAEHLHAVIDGVGMDLQRRQYETFEELAEYCHRVASAVGLACIHIWGFRGREAIEPARRCGVAMQLTNILRDLKEDAQRGRIYLPREDFRQCGYSAEELTAGVADERFVRLVRLESGRARRFYREGAELIRWLEPDGQRVFGMMVTVYGRLLDKIDRHPAAVLARRVGLGRWEKLCIAARWALLPARRSALP